MTKDITLSSDIDLRTRFPDLPPDVIVRTMGRPEAIAAELAKAHDLTLAEAQVALSELPPIF